MRSCGPGTQTRSRACTNPPPSGEGAPCDGDATETRMCNTVDCPCRYNVGSAPTVILTLLFTSEFV